MSLQTCVGYGGVPRARGVTLSHVAFLSKGDLRFLGNSQMIEGFELPITRVTSANQNITINNSRGEKRRKKKKEKKRGWGEERKKKKKKTEKKETWSACFPHKRTHSNGARNWLIPNQTCNVDVPQSWRTCTDYEIDQLQASEVNCVHFNT